MAFLHLPLPHALLRAGTTAFSAARPHRASALLLAGGLAWAGSVYPANAVNGSGPIPKAFRGDWSTRLEYCGKDSDGNYTIGSAGIQAWEVSWTISEVSTGRRNRLRMMAIHQEYGVDTRAAITINPLSPGSIVFQECIEGYCWEVTLQKCPG